MAEYRSNGDGLKCWRFSDHNIDAVPGNTTGGILGYFLTRVDRLKCSGLTHQLPAGPIYLAIEPEALQRARHA